MIETEVEIITRSRLTDLTIKGYPYLALAKDTRIYIPFDKKVWRKYGVIGSIVKGEKNYTIKRGSDNICYIIFIRVLHDKTVELSNIAVTIDGELINELNYDTSLKFFSYIRRLIEVSPNSDLRVEFDVGNEHHTVLYTMDGMKAFLDGIEIEN